MNCTHGLLKQVLYELIHDTFKNEHTDFIWKPT